jgi:hypothetical protein
MHIAEHAKSQITALSWLILDQTHQQVLHFLPRQNKIRKKHFTLLSLRRNRFDIGYVEKTLENEYELKLKTNQLDL